MVLRSTPSPARALLRALALVCLAAVAACEVPDRPAALPEPLPESLLDALRPDTLRVVRVGDGVFYRYLWSDRGPWALHLVEADLRRCRLGLEVVRAPQEAGMAGGRARVSEMAADHARRVLAAVNGDFFTPDGLPLGPEVVAGLRRSGRTRPALAARASDLEPWIGPVGVSRRTVEGPGWPLEGEGPRAVQVVGGYPELLDRGARVGDLEVSSNPSFAASRHPRSAVALDTLRDRLWLVVTDGRQGDYATGMTLPELTDVLEALGATEALNLDGGGSSVLVVRGRPVNRPSDDAGERPVVNALLLVDDPAFCEPPAG